MRYQKFDPAAMARRSLNYLTRMVDDKNDHLPYWLILPNKKPAEAAHCRVDDAELVGSWYEGLESSMHVLDTQQGAEVLESFKRFLMSGWGEHGLRFHNKYPWTHTMHSSFHEMGYILPALNRLSEKYPDDAQIEARISGLIKGMRSLVIERKVRTFWNGDMKETEPIYEFPNDVYLQDGGFDLTCHTGRGEQAIRNSIMLHSLVRRYELKNDTVAMDLACGIANHVLGPSRYFSWDMNFFGHVHSAMWFASGLARLGRVIGRDEYVQKARGIYAFVRSQSSSFGWVPEYARWHPMDEEHCESCCIKDMIECAFELIDCGYDEYWTDVVLFSRNQLVENQISYSGYVTDDNSLPDENGITYHDISSRMIGGYTGGSLPNSISLAKFRSIAGCCAGIAPIAVAMVWDRAVTEKDGSMCVNIPMDKAARNYTLKSEYPEKGCVSITPKTDACVSFRVFPFMKGKLKVSVDGVDKPFERKNEVIIVGSIKAGQKVSLSHPLRTALKTEHCAGRDYKVLWRGCDVIDILPHGEHLRLFQRDLSIPKVLPKPADVIYTGAANYGPTQQSSASAAERK
ncbi:MAG: hypothetical protein K5663_01345 [Clostridiales bacterium]|nr:hypothetical protein [Clostridiales bacterium]